MVLPSLFESLFSPSLLAEIININNYKKVKAGEQIIDYNQPITFMPLLIEGAIKIMRQDDKGDELLLYFLERGDTCVMTMTCCMGQTKSEVRAVAEKDSILIMIPVSKMADWVVKYPSWRSFVFESYNNRFNEMLEAIDSLAFLNMHDRILKYLKDKVMVTGATTLTSTHQEIAFDLHSSRVVVSRILKSLEKDGLIKMYRNKIEVLNF